MALVHRCGWDAVRSIPDASTRALANEVLQIRGKRYGKGQVMSATKLVIVESPAKAATIEGYLGPDFT